MSTYPDSDPESLRCKCGRHLPCRHCEPSGEGLGASTCSPCPFCGEMDKLVVDCSSLVTSQLGIDYQSGNVDCESCGAAGPYVHAKGRETDRLTEMIWEAWNHRENTK